MTATIKSPSVRTDVELRKEPAKRWRNRWFTPKRGLSVNGEIIPPGEFEGLHIYPSRDIAETYAACDLEKVEPKGCGFKYLGAFPIEGESQ